MNKANESYRVSVFRDGSWVEERTDRGAPAATVIVDTARSRRVVADHRTQSLTTSYAQVLPRFAPPCTAASNSPHKTMLGHEVRLSSQTEQVGGATLRTESWVAPAVNCFPLQTTVYYRKPGTPEVVVTVRKVTRLALQEPPASARTVPGHYVERKPSDVYREYSRRNPDAPLNVHPSAAADQDRAYDKGRQP